MGTESINYPATQCAGEARSGPGQAQAQELQPDCPAKNSWTGGNHEVAGGITLTFSSCLTPSKHSYINNIYFIVYSLVVNAVVNCK